MIGPSQRPLPDNTQHSQQRDIHVPGGIRTHNLNRRAAADLRLRPLGYWDRQIKYIDLIICIIQVFLFTFILFLWRDFLLDSRFFFVPLVHSKHGTVQHCRQTFMPLHSTFTYLGVILDLIFHTILCYMCGSFLYTQKKSKIFHPSIFGKPADQRGLGANICTEIRLNKKLRVKTTNKVHLSTLNTKRLPLHLISRNHNRLITCCRHVL